MSNTPQSTEKKYKLWINIVSIAVPVVVALLFSVRLPNVEPLSFLPPIYASINGITAILLVLALIAIKNRKTSIHENLMKFFVNLLIFPLYSTIILQIMVFFNYYNSIEIGQNSVVL